MIRQGSRRSGVRQPLDSLTLVFVAMPSPRAANGGCLLYTSDAADE